MANEIIVRLIADPTALKAGYKEGAIATKEFGAELDAANVKMKSGFASAAKSAAKLSAVFIGAGGLYEAVKQGVEEMDSLEKANKLVAQGLKTTHDVSGETAANIRKMSEAMAKKTAVDKAQIQSADALLLRFTNVRDVAGTNNDIFKRATQAALDVSAAMGRSLTPTVIQLGKALQDPGAKMTSLARMGITFTKTQVDMVKHLQSTGHVLDAQKYILDQLAKRYGGSAAAASHTFKGSIDRLKNSFRDMSAEMIQSATPAITRITDRMSNWLSKTSNQKKVMHDLNSVLSTAGHVLKTVWGWIDKLQGIMGGWKNTITILAGAWAGYTLGVKAAGLASTIMGAETETAIAGIKGALISTGIGALFVGLGIAAAEIITHWKKVKQWFGEFMNWFKSSWVQYVVDVVAPIIGIPLEIIAHWKTLKEWFGTFVRYTKAIFVTIPKALKAALYDVANEIVQKLTSMADEILGVMSHIPFVGGKFKRAKEAVDAFAQHFQDRTDAAFASVRKSFDKQLGNLNMTVHISTKQASRTGGMILSSTGQWVPSGQSTPSPKGGGIVSTARWAAAQPGASTSYQFGGTPGIGAGTHTDCSGFTKAVYAKHGITLPRTSQAQYAGPAQAKGHSIRPTHPSKGELRPGDLVFFNYEGPHSHVGIYIGGGFMIADQHTGSGIINTPVDWGAYDGAARYGGTTSKRGGGGGGGAGNATAPTASDVTSYTKPPSSSHKHTHKHHAAVASAAQIAGLGIDIGQELKRAGADVAYMTKNHIAPALDASIKAIEAKMRKLRAELKKHLTAKQLANIRQQYDNLKKLLDQKLTAAEKAIKAHKAKIKKALQDALDLKNLLAGMQMDAAMQAYDQKLQDAFDKSLESDSPLYKKLQAAQAVLANLQAAQQSLQDKLETSDQAYNIGNLQTSLAHAIATGSTSAIAEAQQALNDAQLQAQIDGYQQQIDAQQSAVDTLQQQWDDYKTAQDQIFSDMLSDWDQYASLLEEQGKLTVDNIQKYWQDFSDWYSANFSSDGTPSAGGGSSGGGSGSGSGPPPPPHGSCFTHDTPVATPHGDVWIEDIENGDRVLVWEFESMRIVEAKAKLVVHEPAETWIIELESGREIHTTKEHPFLIDEAWRPAGDLVPGKKVAVADRGVLMRDRVIAVRTGPIAPVYNLHVDHPDHNYFADGCLVHNAMAKMAAGGVVKRPTFALIGEAGPEAVIPLNKIRSIGGAHGSGGAGLTVHIHAGTIIGGNKEQVAKDIVDPLYRELLKRTKRNTGLHLY